jgi:predicted RNase H-like HicB family nuclease
VFAEDGLEDTGQAESALTVTSIGFVNDGDGNRYSMLLEWEPEGGVFVVTVPELPGRWTHGSTYEEAVRHGQEVIELWIDSARKANERIPPPRHFDLDSIETADVAHFTMTGDDDEDALPYQERIVAQMLARVEEARRAPVGLAWRGATDLAPSG